MKKLKLIAIGLMLYGFSYSQNPDTLCFMTAGKVQLEFNYNNSEIINKKITKNFEDLILKIKPNQVLYLDLYDNCPCNKHQNIIKKRHIKLYHRNGTVSTDLISSGEENLRILGENIEKIIVSKPLKF